MWLIYCMERLASFDCALTLWGYKYKYKYIYIYTFHFRHELSNVQIGSLMHGWCRRLLECLALLEDWWKEAQVRFSIYLEVSLSPSFSWPAQVYRGPTAQFSSLDTIKRSWKLLGNLDLPKERHRRIFWKWLKMYRNVQNPPLISRP